MADEYLKILETLLKNRGIKSRHEANEFLNPPKPETFRARDFGLDYKQVLKGIRLVKRANSILIYGDYDADGITSTAIVFNSLKKLNKHVYTYIPDRERDGYGVNAKNVFEFLKKNRIQIDLVICVDNGISHAKEIKKIRAKNVEVLIIDHHQKLQEIPRANAIIHSTKTSASGLCFYFAKKLGNYSDLETAVIGIVTDCVPLTGINRSLVKWGLKKMNSNPLPWLKEVIDSCKLGEVKSYHLGYVIGPRINAGGRLGDTSKALELMTTNKNTRIRELVDKINQQNSERQQRQQKSMTEAEKEIRGEDKKVILATSKSWEAGIIGLIAGKICEKYNVPTIIICEGKEISKGSCRSIKGFDIAKVLKKCAKYLIDFGGHSEAAGFSILTKNISKFEKAIQKIAKTKKIDQKESKKGEFALGLDKVNTKILNIINKLEPFGSENENPMIEFKDFSISAVKKIGSIGQHQKFWLSNKEHIIGAVMFNRVVDIDNHKSYHILGRMSENEWRGDRKVEIIIDDIFEV